MTASAAPATLKHDALTALRTLGPLEALYMQLRSSGLREALSRPGVPAVGHVAELIEQLRGIEQELDLELTGELLHLKDLLQQRTMDYARLQYGISVGGHIRLPNASAGIPGKLKVTSIQLVDEAEYDLRVVGNPVRDDGSTSTEQVDLLVSPDAVKVRMPEAPKRDQLRAKVHR